MAEIVEINLICDENLNHKILLSFIHKFTVIDYGSKSIEVMENWEYEKYYKINSEENLEQLINTKIVCITEKAEEGYVGLNIEKIDDKFCYTMWFNQEKYELESEYHKLIEAVIIFISQRIKNQLNLCTIGKEVVFEYQDDYNELFASSHNIDIWIVLDNLFDFEKEITDSNLTKYEKCNIDKFVVLKDRKINI